MPHEQTPWRCADCNQFDCICTPPENMTETEALQYDDWLNSLT